MEKKFILAQLNMDIESRIGRGVKNDAFIPVKEFKDYFTGEMFMELNAHGSIWLENYYPEKCNTVEKSFHINPANTIAEAIMIAYSNGEGNAANFFETFKDDEMENEYCMDKLNEFWHHKGPIFKIISEDPKVLDSVDEYGLCAFGIIASTELGANKDSGVRVTKIKMLHLSPAIHRNIPKCLDICHVDGCDMRSLHCSNRDCPPMSRCTKCNYWFTNLEKRNAI